MTEAVVLIYNKHGIRLNPDYWFLVARLEAKNNIHTIIEGYIKSDSKKPLVIVGNYDSPQYEEYNQRYCR